ncbi:MAG: hypothetical protein U0V73_05725 [Acidimicrobiia bacterium]
MSKPDLSQSRVGTSATASAIRRDLAQTGDRAAGITRRVLAANSGPLRAVSGLVVAAWCVVLVLYGRQRFIHAPDAAINYAHVWWISRHVWHGFGLPLRIGVLGSGRSFTFPYGFVNWLFASALWPLLGDRAVTLTTVVGVGVYLVAVIRLSRGSPLARILLLVNPALVHALFFDQQSFIWSIALLAVAAGLWRSGRRCSGAITLGIAQANHVAVVLPMVAILLGAGAIARVVHRDLLRAWLFTLPLSIPFVIEVLGSPTYGATSTGAVFYNFYSTVLVRLPILVVPILLFLALRRSPQALWLAIAVVILGWRLPYERLNRGMVEHVLQLDSSTADHVRLPTAVVPHHVYRVLSGRPDAKFASYTLLEAGATLDHEFFQESTAWRSFATVPDYERLLCARHVDEVVVTPSFHDRHTNEQEMLDQLSSQPGQLVSVSLTHRAGHTSWYHVSRNACSGSG